MTTRTAGEAFDTAAAAAAGAPPEAEDFPAARAARRRRAEMVTVGPTIRDQVSAARHSPTQLLSESPLDGCRAELYRCVSCHNWKLSSVMPKRPRGEWEFDTGRKVTSMRRTKVCNWCYSYLGDANWLGWLEGPEHPLRDGTLRYSDVQLLASAAVAADAAAVYPTTRPNIDWTTGRITDAATRSELEAAEATLGAEGRRAAIRVHSVCREGSKARWPEENAENRLAHPACYSAQLLNRPREAGTFPPFEAHFAEPCHRCLLEWGYPQCGRGACGGCYNTPAFCGTVFWRRREDGSHRADGRSPEL